MATKDKKYPIKTPVKLLHRKHVKRIKQWTRIGKLENDVGQKWHSKDLLETSKALQSIDHD